ncbi:uncharacterized protein LOC144791972 [Lissotriton helveticus]
MTGYEMRRTKGKEPLQQWSCMYHQSGGSSTQVSRTHLIFSYPVPPYMYLRMIVRKAIVFTPRARTLIDMLKRFELRDLVAKRTSYISSSRPATQNNITVAHSPGWNQNVMLSSEKRKSSEDAHKWHLKHGNGEEERVRNTEDNEEESSNREGTTLKFRHFKEYKAKVTDTIGKQLCKGDSAIIAKPLNSNKDTLDIHTYSFVGTVPRKLRPTLESSSILEKFLEDDMLRSVLEDLLGDSESLSELENFVHDSESFSRIEEFPEAPATHPNIDRLWENAASSPTSRLSPKAHIMRTMRLLGSTNRIPVALNLSGTNRYLACETPPSLTLETLGKAPDKVEDDSEKRLIFWHGIENKLSSFESVLHPGYYLCTRTGGSPSNLELWNNPQLQQAISEFVVSI